MGSAIAATLALLGTGLAVPAAAVEHLDIRVHRTIPHDTEAFTQGLLWHDGKLYESTGRYGHSDLRRIDPATGTVEQRRPISKMHFGEGLARIDDHLVMLTWRAGRALVFGIDSFRRLGDHRYRGEGWGLCHDGSRFVMSNGSARLIFRDSRSFARIGMARVTMDGVPLPRLNELECVQGAVYANIYGRDFIVRIDPATGRVMHRIDARSLRTRSKAKPADVLNGIAYDPVSQRFYLTGKLWPLMFETSFAP